MNKLLYYLFCLIVLNLINQSSQAQIFLCPNDTICLTIGSFYGNIQWQESADNISWSDISGAISDTSCIIAADSTYYRAVVTSGSCDPYYSDTSFIVLSHLEADAGMDSLTCGDSILLGGNPTAFNGIPPYTYSWTPTNDLSDSSSANPMASVSSTTYFLEVTDSLGCKAFDTISIGPTPTVTNPSSMPINWYTSTYQYGYEFNMLATKTVVAIEYVYTNLSGVSGYVRIWTSGGNLVSSTAITTTGTSNWEHIPISPVT